MAQARPHVPVNQEKGITVDMDIDKNPGPAVVSNFGFSSFVDSRIGNFNSHLESSPLFSSSHLLRRFINSCANSQQRFVYSRDELFSIRFGSTKWKLSRRLLSHLKVNSSLRYRGKRVGKSKQPQIDDRAIPVLKVHLTPLFAKSSLLNIRSIWAKKNLGICLNPRFSMPFQSRA